MNRMRLAVALLLVPLLGGCAGAYFAPAQTRPPEPPPLDLAALPYRELWTGLVFNGHKIGFSHLAIRPAEGETGLLEVRSEAAMRLRFLGIDKRVTLRSSDRVHPDLTLAAFAYDYDLDGSRIAVSGEVRDGRLEARVVNAGLERRIRVALDGPLYPVSLLNYYPLARGIRVGDEHRFRVFDGETRQVTEVEQAVLAYESSELFEGNAWRIRTRMHGQEVTTWIDSAGRPLLEMSLGGVFIAGLESEEMARRYLTLAALNKEETLLDLSRVPSEPSIERPREVSGLELEIEGPAELEIPSDARQRCAPRGRRWHCRIGALLDAPQDGDVPDAADLRSTLPVPSRERRIRALAAELTAGAASDGERIEALLGWIEANIERQAVDVFSALDVLRTRKAECQGHSYLYAAMARSLGIPTRIVNGLVYSESGGGFLYHTWTESYADGRWRAVDPVLGQARADATHVKLIEGERLEELAPLLGYLGRLKARVLEVRHRAGLRPPQSAAARASSSSRPGSAGFQGLPGWMMHTGQFSAASISSR